MQFYELLNKLNSSQTFKDFEERNPKAFFCAGFFILNFKANIFDYSLDYRDQENLFSFKIAEDKEVVINKEPIIKNMPQMEKINCDVQIDIEDLKNIVNQNLQKNNIKNKLEEIIAVLQSYQGNKIWNLTCICESFAIINMHINPENGQVIKFEKKNLLDFASFKKKQ